MTQNNEREAFESLMSIVLKSDDAYDYLAKYSTPEFLGQYVNGDVQKAWVKYLENTASPISQNEQQPKQIPAVTSYDLASEEDETVYWLQSDIQKKGWGPFKTEIDAWKYLFGREPSEEEIAEYKNADWYVGFINTAPANTEVGE